VSRDEPRRPSADRLSVSGSSIIGVALFFAVAIVIARRWTEGAHFAQLLKRAEPLWLFVAAGLQALTYVCAGRIWQIGLGRMRVRLPLGQAFQLALDKLFVDNLVPTTGLSGNMFVVNALGRRGVQPARALTAMVVNLLGSYVAYAACILASIGFLWALHHLTTAVIVVTAIFGVVAISVPVAIVVLVHRRDRLPNAPRWVRKVPGLRTLVPALADVDAAVVADKALLAWTAALEVSIVALDAGTLWILLRAVGVHAHVANVFVAYSVAQIASLVSITPGGLGTFEAAAVAMLTTFGVAVAPALTATLLLRGFTFWLPMLPGFLLARHELRGARAMT
jgi:uncharacterized protein (TIRG00374 family)